MTFVALPKEYPQTICGVVGCKRKLYIPNNNILTSKLCKFHAKECGLK
jgi:hypothetical protein